MHLSRGPKAAPRWSEGAKGNALVGGGPVSPFTPGGRQQLPARKAEQRVQASVTLRGSGSGAKEGGPSPAQALELPVMPPGAGTETQAAAAWGGQSGRAPQQGGRGVPCPASPGVLSVAVGRLVAELPVVVGAVALDVDAADTVPQFEGLLIFAGGGLAAAAARGLQ